MAMRVNGPGFESELEAQPEDVFVSGGALGRLGLSFGDFAYRDAGTADVWVTGVQIGACRSPRGVSMTTDGNDAVQLVDDAIIVRTPGSSSRATWTHSFHGQFLVVAPETIERIFHLPLGRLTIATSGVTAMGALPVASHLLSAISSELAAGNPGGPMLIESLGASALHTMIRLPDERRPQGRLTSEQARTVRDLLVACSAEPLSLDDIAKAIDLSVGHMLRAFKRTFGVTPHQYLIRERIEQACILLKVTTRPIDDIAIACGFGSRAQMVRTFRMQLGVAPKAFRKTV